MNTKLRSLIREMVYENLKEFREDLGKQCIVLMGLPAAGKSTFINNEITKYFPGFKGYKVTNSDIQVLAAQYRYAKEHYEWLLSNINDENDLKKFVKDSKYVNNDGKDVYHPITMQWWEENKGKGFKTFYKTFYKPYYATYFDIRDMAKKRASELFQTKVVEAGNLLVVDTVASHPNKIFKILEKTREKEFNNTIIYLEIDPSLSIQRDQWRKEHHGRGVGADVINNYAKQMDGAYDAYVKNGKQSDGLVDRLMHFIWQPAGDSPVKGTWVKKEDYRFALKRRLKK